jgi:Protein of unknown function (DUF4038)
VPTTSDSASASASSSRSRTQPRTPRSRAATSPPALRRARRDPATAALYWESIAQVIEWFTRGTTDSVVVPTGCSLISYHPWGEESSTDMWPNDDTVLDFNMIQSGHKKKPLEAIADQLGQVYAKDPPMPEPCR